MREYHKIQTVYHRDPENNNKTLIEGKFSLPEFEYLARNPWVFTEKVHGTNMRAHFVDEAVTIAGRTMKDQLPPFLIQAVSDEFEDILLDLNRAFEGKEVVFFGEGCGAKVQKGGGNYRQDQGFVLFDVMVDGLWLERANVEDVAVEFAMDIAPVIGEGTLFDMVEMVREGLTSQWGDFTAEGIVARPATEMQTRRGERIITKVKGKDFSRSDRFAG